MSDVDNEVGLATELWRPSVLLAALEDQAVRTAKFLHANHAKLDGLTKRASVDEAIALAEWIVALAGYGRKQTASEALRIAEMAEILSDRLSSEMESLTKTK